MTPRLKCKLLLNGTCKACRPLKAWECLDCLLNECCADEVRAQANVVYKGFIIKLGGKCKTGLTNNCCELEDLSNSGDVSTLDEDVLVANDGLWEKMKPLADTGTQH